MRTMTLKIELLILGALIAACTLTAPLLEGTLANL
jgi:hypothetical protein